MEWIAPQEGGKEQRHYLLAEVIVILKGKGRKLDLVIEK